MEIFHVAILLICFHGDCTRFESAPYSKDLSSENCERMLSLTFKTKVGPYYDDLLDFNIDKPEDIKIVYGSCDPTTRQDTEWRIIPDVDPEQHEKKQNGIKWQTEEGEEI